MDPLEQYVNKQMKQSPQSEQESNQNADNDPLAHLGGQVVSTEELAKREEAKSYEKPSKMAAATAAGAARGLTFGLSDVLGAAIGQQEELRKLKEYQPGLSTVGEVGGAIAGVFGELPGALLAKGAEAATKAIASPLAKVATKEALEGAAYGIGTTVSDQALGSKQDLSENLIANVGMGALLGAGFGMGAHGVAEGAKGLSNQVKKVFKGEATAAEASVKANAQSKVKSAQSGLGLSENEQKIINELSVSPGTQEVEQTITGPTFKAPTSLQELEQFNIPEIQTQMTAQRRLGEIEQIVPDLQVKPLKYHYEMLENPAKMQELKLEFENLPSKDAQKIAIYNDSMVKEAEAKTADTIEALSNNPVQDIREAGNTFINKVKKTYEGNKKETAPLFEKMKSLPSLTPEETQELKLAIVNNTKAASLLKQDKETGMYYLKGNNSKTGLSDTEHKLISRVFQDLEGSPTFKEIQNSREFLRKSLDLVNPQATEEIGKVRSILLDQLESIGSNKVPELRDTFKKYAINERSVDNIEKIIGGQISNIDSIFLANPDKVMDKVLSNPNYKKIIEDYVGKEAFNNLAASYVKRGFENSIDNVKGFLPHKMRNFLDKNEVNLKSIIGEPAFNRLSALSDHGFLAKRFLDKVNPSGTAASLIKALEPMALTQKIVQQGPVGALKSELAQSVFNLQKQQQAINAFNEAMGAAEVAGKVKQKQSLQVLNKLKTFLTVIKKPIVGATTVAITGSNKDYDKRLDDIREIATNPKKYTEAITKNTKGLANIDPQLQEMISQTGFKAAQFLQSKAPKNPFENSMFKSPIKWKPSDAELSKFNRYVKAIDDPFSILDDMNENLLSPESVEAVQTIYPQIYADIQKKAVEQVGQYGQSLPFAKQLQLSLLLGQPVASAQNVSLVNRLQTGAQLQGQQEQAKEQGQAQARPKSKKLEGGFLANNQSQSENLIRSRGNNL